MSVQRNILASLVCFIALNGFAQTADELVAKNLQAKGGAGEDQGDQVCSHDRRF